jgi:signal transduction histidine kinase
MLFLKDADEDRISLRECYGMPMIEGAFYDLGKGKTGKVASDGTAILESQADPNYIGKYDEVVTQYLRPNQQGSRVIKSFMAVPISIVERRQTDQPGRGLPVNIYRPDGEALEDEREIFSADPSSERIIGVLKVFNKTYGAGEFDDDDLSVLATFASQIGVVFAFADRSAALSDLADGVCHEIRQKIGSIKRNLGLVKEGLLNNATVSKKLEEPTDRIQAAANEASEFTNMVLGFASGHFQRPQRLNINPLISEAVTQLKPNYQTLAEANHITVIEDYCLEHVICSVFRTPFIQIVQNIVANAYEAMDRTNGGTLKISTALSDSKKAVLIKISDTGRGISPDDLPHIYKSRFYRRPGGNGLGLWLVRRFLPQMDGIISVESTVDLGTTFTIQMPVVSVQTSEEIS